MKARGPCQDARNAGRHCLRHNAVALRVEMAGTGAVNRVGEAVPRLPGSSEVLAERRTAVNEWNLQPGTCFLQPLLCDLVPVVV